MRKPSTLWYLENHSITSNHQGVLILQFIFRRCGLNRILTKDLHVIQIPLFAHQLPAVNIAMQKAVLHFATKQNNDGTVTEMIFSKAKLPRYWVLGDHHKVANVFYKLQEAKDFCEKNTNESQAFVVFELKTYGFEYRGEPMFVELKRIDTKFSKTIFIPLLNMPKKQNDFYDQVKRGLNDVRSNAGKSDKKHKKMIFAHTDHWYQILRWWVFNSKMQPKKCHVDRNELIRRLRDTPYMS
jgi:hypothetical protein